MTSHNMSEGKYVVVYATENSDLYHGLYDDIEEARAFVESIEDKAIIVKCEVGYPENGPVVTVEDHT